MVGSAPSHFLRMHPVLSTFLKLAAVLLLVALNGFFVCAEFALIKVRSTQMKTLSAKGHRRARLAEKVVSHLESYLSATQLGVTIASLGLGWAGEPFVAELLEVPLTALGISSRAWLHSISFAVGFITITFLHIVLGELGPKIFANRKPQQATLLVVLPLTLFYEVTYPVLWMLNRSANWLLNLVGIRAAGELELAHSEEELRLLLSGGIVSDIGRSVSLRALDLHKRIARQVMKPRTQIVYFSTQWSLDENLDVARKSKHTRFPLCEGSLDHVLGIIHMKDLIWMISQQDKKSLVDIKREVLFIPETTSLELVLNTFRARRLHLAILIDEFGGTVGMITLEDIVEEIVGEIQDEFDQESPRCIAAGDNAYRVDGSLPLHELQQTLGTKFEAEDVATIGGYVVNRLGSFPNQGDRLDLGEWDCTVLKTDGRRIQQVLLKRKR